MGQGTARELDQREVSGFAVVVSGRRLWLPTRWRRWLLRTATAESVCGQLAGAYWGESGIPSEWLNGLAKQDMIETALAGLMNGNTPVKVTKPSLPQLAIPAIAPPTIRSYWVIEGTFLAGAYPGSPDQTQHRQRIEELWKAGIRTFINFV